MTYYGNQIKSITDAYTSQGQYSVKEYQNKAGNNSQDKMSYDANGNMIKDLDRDIVTIKYNLLNLPDLIQFKNGCQIKNTYSADGQKLSSRYVTVAEGVYQPLNPGQVIENLDVNENDNVTVDGTDYLGNIEYQVYRYFDWDLTYEPVEQKYLYRVHNPEGYVSTFGINSSYGPAYNYYRKDHLGNNREVWNASYKWGSATRPAATSQRTQYYPSGLPWKYNIGDNPGTQPYKYNDKEFVEMHGLDEYDSKARWYYPAIMRTTTMDPLAENYYDVSPYAWCGNNPKNAVDLKGDSVTILNLGSGTSQHMGILIQNENGKWQYYSVNGDNVYNATNGIIGGRPFDDLAVGEFDSPQQFLDSQYNSKGDKNDKDGTNSYGYTEGYVLPTTPEQDKTIAKTFKSVSTNEEYNIISNNCATAVQKALNSVEINTTITRKETDSFVSTPSKVYNSWLPSEAFRAIKTNYSNGIYLRPKK